MSVCLRDKGLWNSRWPGQKELGAALISAPSPHLSSCFCSELRRRVDGAFLRGRRRLTRFPSTSPCRSLRVVLPRKGTSLGLRREASVADVIQGSEAHASAVRLPRVAVYAVYQPAVLVPSLSHGWTARPSCPRSSGSSALLFLACLRAQSPFHPGLLSTLPKLRCSTYTVSYFFKCFSLSNRWSASRVGTIFNQSFYSHPLGPRLSHSRYSVSVLINFVSVSLL